MTSRKNYRSTDHGPLLRRTLPFEFEPANLLPGLGYGEAGLPPQRHRHPVAARPQERDVILTDVDPDERNLDHALRLIFSGATRVTVRLEMLVRGDNPAVRGFLQ